MNANLSALPAFDASEVNDRFGSAVTERVVRGYPTCDTIAMTAKGSDRTAAVQNRNAVSLPVGSPLPEEAPIRLAPAANSHFPPILTKTTYWMNGKKVRTPAIW